MRGKTSFAGTTLTLVAVGALAASAHAQIATYPCDEMQEGLTLLILDEETIDNGISTIEMAAYDCGVEPDYLVNDDMPTEFGNPPLYWNAYCPGGEYLLPSGQYGDEGVFAPGPGTGLDLSMFIAGFVPQEWLDEVPDVTPLHNEQLEQLVGTSFVAVVYDSDVSIDYEYGMPYANLQGERYGLFFFTVLGVMEPSLPESQSSGSLYDLYVRVDEVPAEFCYVLFQPGEGCDDSDSDGTCDEDDRCPFDPFDECDPCDDSDSDGTCDEDDRCPFDPFDECDPCDDADSDGLCDDEDPCPFDPTNECEPPDDCLTLLIIDEETIDNGTSTVEMAAYACGVDPDVLVNDDRPTEYGNPPLYWNEYCPSEPDMYWLLPSGQCQDEGLFAPGPATGLDLDMFIAGMIGQDYLDEIPDVHPLRNPDLMQLIGRSCVAVVYDSDVSINYEYGMPYANLKGERYGLFFMTVMDVLPPSLPESGSSSSLYDILVRALRP
ncbi:MAG: hypothetical protein ACYTGC_14535 [Planctomycetota bacterium]|jgi:hypothetical protein